MPEQQGGLDLAAVAEGALVEPRPPQAEAPAPSPRVPVGGSPYGPYRLLERVAIGGMAEVFKAKRTGVEGFEKVLAVKRILPHLSDNKEFVDMFIDEAKMVAGLAHPNIVQIFDLGKIEKSYYIAMEYVHGRDLRSILRRARERDLRIPLDLPVLVVSRVCSALEFAHRKKDERGRAMHDRAPRHQPPEHPDLVRGRGEADRLRHRQGGHQGLHHRRGRPARQAALHEPRAGVGQAHGPPLRHLLAGHRVLRDGHRPPARSWAAPR